MRNILLLAILMAFAFIRVQAQTTYNMRGRLQDGETKSPVSGATVQLKSRHDSAIVFTTLSDSSGRYAFSSLSRDTFNLIISSIGYETLRRTVKVDSADVNMGTILLPKTSKQLSGVTVTAKEPPAVQKGDTVEYNASQFKVNPDATAEDLTRKLPGITIQNGQVTAHGETVQKVTIDGRELFGDDATAALRNLPAEVIDKIQVFDRLSDQAQFSGFDDGNTSKSINIITKANMRNGQYGRVYAGYGTDDRYQAGGNTTLMKGTRRLSLVGLVNNVNQQNFSAQDLLGVTSNAQRGGGGGGPRGGGGGQRGGGGNRGSSGGNQGGGNNGGFGNNSNFMVGQQNGINKTNAAGINYSDLWGPKIQVSGSYFFNNTENTTSQTINRQYYLKNLPGYNEVDNSTSRNTNHRFNMRFDYKIDSANELLIIPNFSFQNNTTDALVHTANAFTPSRLVNESDNTTNSARHGNNLNNSILYRHAFHKRGRTISLSVNTSYNKRDGDIYLQTHSKYYDSTSHRDTAQRQFTNQMNDGQQIGVNLAYTEPLGKRSMLQLNYNPTFSKSNADQETYRYDLNSEKYSMFDTSLSSRFNNGYNAQNAGASYRYGTRDNQVSVGLNYQHSVLNSDELFPKALTVNKSFNNFLPNAFIRLKFSARSNIRIMYRASTAQPSVTQLQNVYDFTNPPYITAGNPDLLQQYNHTLSTRYTYTNAAKGTLFVANVFMQAAKNYITNASFIPARDSAINSKVIILQGQQLTKPVNLDGYMNVRSFLTFAVPVKFIKSNFNMNGGVSYSQLPGIINNVHNISKNLTYTLGSVIASNVSQYVDFTLSYSANYNVVKNAIQPQLNNNYFYQIAGVQMNLLSKKGWYFQNDLNNQLYSGLAQGYNQNYWLWNMGVGKKFLKNQKGDLRLSVFDLLKQNRSITRNVTETYIEDVANQVLRQYFMLTFTYNLRNFGKGPARPAFNNNNRREWQGF